ncbi:hypothetical protein Tco_0497110 [Tanacetum coccineum]
MPLRIDGLSLLPLGAFGALSDLACFFLTLAFVFGGSTPEAMLMLFLMPKDNLYCGEHVVIPGKVPIYLVSSWNRLILSHEEVDDDLGEARVVHLITSLDILVIYLVNKVLPQKKLLIKPASNFCPGLLQLVDIESGDHFIHPPMTKIYEKREN